MKHMALLMALVLGASPASAQEAFDLQLDHATVLTRDLEASATFYGEILHLEALETPWGPTRPVRFFSLGGSRQLHVGLADGIVAPNKDSHLAFAIQDFDAYLRFLMDQEIEYADFPGRSREPQVRPDGVRQVFLQDPDGNWIEINDAVHPPS